MTDTLFLSRLLSGALILDDTILGKIAKGRGKTSVKMEKTGNVPRSKTRNRQTTLKITIQGDC